MWAILYFLFKFNMFNGAQWHRLFNSRLCGFPGFVFGILILSALPLYVATTTLVVRKKAPLVTIPVPKISLLKKPCPAPPTDTTPDTDQDKKEPSPELSPDIPPELHAAFIRARQLVRANITANAHATAHENTDTTNDIANLSAITTPTPVQSPITEIDVDTNEQINDDFPLPSDFDIAFDDQANIPDDFAPMSAPIFKEISFDDNTPAPDAPAPSAPATPDVRPDISTLTQYLDKNNQTYHVENDIVITDTHAIATHSDPDFWVVDTENWFAAGKVRTSPITDAINMAHEHKKTPAIYLASENILDIDSLKQTWTSDGITVITDLSEL